MKQVYPTSSLLIGRHAKEIGAQGLTNIFLENEAVDDVKNPDTGSEEVIGLTDKSHALTISANALERLQTSIIPNLLTYSGSVVVVDLSGEAYAATAKARRDMGQTVVRLDPFRVVDEESNSLNPIDLLQGVDNSSYESTCQDIAALIPGFNALSDIWDGNAFGLLSGVIGYISTVPEKCKFSDIYDVFHNDDVVYNLAVVLDTIGNKLPKMSYSEISAFLQKADLERSRILSAITVKIKAMNTEAVRNSMNDSTVSPEEIIQGKPVSVYLMIPPEMMATHYSLIRIWVGTLLRCARDKRFKSEVPMLFLLDEVAKYSPFPQMQAAITSPTASNSRIWTFWQDIMQLRTFCPGSWILENCGVIQAFGMRDFDASSELAAVLGLDPKILQTLAAYEQIVSVEGASERITKLDYRTDRLFQDLSKRST